MKNNYTRGSGLLESFLAKQRAKKVGGLIEGLSRRERLLDIGCGSFPYFLTITDFKEKYGIDPSVNKDLTLDKSINLLTVDVGGKNLPFKDNFFDAVTMLAVFEHIDNEKLQNVIADIKRVLNNDGILIITTPAPWADKLLHFMAKFGLISSEEIHEHKHNHPRAKIEDIINKAGFKKSNIESGFFEFHMNMWFVAKK